MLKRMFARIGVVGGIAGTAIAITATAALAYFLICGTGAGTAEAYDPKDPTVTVSVDTKLFPGSTAAYRVTVKNEADVPITVQQLKLKVTSGKVEFQSCTDFSTGPCHRPAPPVSQYCSYTLVGLPSNGIIDVPDVLLAPGASTTYSTGLPLISQAASDTGTCKVTVTAEAEARLGN